MAARVARGNARTDKSDGSSRARNDVMTTDAHENSSVLLQRVKDFHRPLYVRDRSGTVDQERQPVCTGCEVFFWPCPTVKLADGTWESVPV